MRAFIAVDLPSRFAEEVSDVSDDLSSMLRGRFLSAEGFHVTLAFLGEISDEQAELASQALAEACADAAPCDLAPVELGTFGRPIDATLWMGLQPSPELTGLAQAVRARLSERGIPFDDAEFVPHVTLARHSRILRDALPNLQLPAPARAEWATLYKSVLSDAGATYYPISRVKLP